MSKNELSAMVWILEVRLYSEFDFFTLLLLKLFYICVLCIEGLITISVPLLSYLHSANCVIKNFTLH
jgi:hypothetical protein